MAADSQSIESNKSRVRRVYEQAWNERNLSVIDELYTPESVHHDPSNPEPLTGVEGIKRRISEVTEAFPDLTFAIEQVVAEDETVVVYWTVSGTQRGEFAGVPPTDTHVEGVQGVTLHRIADGHIVKEWAIRDTLGLLRQLGVAPTPGRPSDS